MIHLDRTSVPKGKPKGNPAGYAKSERYFERKSTFFTFFMFFNLGSMIIFKSLSRFLVRKEKVPIDDDTL